MASPEVEFRRFFRSLRNTFEGRKKRFFIVRNRDLLPGEKARRGSVYIDREGGE